MVLVVILLLSILALSVLPQMWVTRVIARHSTPRNDIGRSGADVARYLLQHARVPDVAVQKTDLGDHYDPEDRVVRLLPKHYEAQSLAAAVIAAHEVGHAIQDYENYRPLKQRTRIAKQAQQTQKLGFFVMLAAPIMLLLFKSPAILAIEFGAGILLIGITVIMHAYTLPVEFDASFKRALPLLRATNLIPANDFPAAREILWAAALTYVAAAAMSMLDVMRWLRVLRF
ncbi:MAG: zinc metallopeptidase [Hyphomicrobiaceae bacterium TMED74]|nr:MAG: zinc metallopeptidase [Hyphomicrobiaceae bacterium TMED74]